MQCITLKKGVECAFMTNKGCNFNGGRCHSVVEKCEGCSRTLTADEGHLLRCRPQPRHQMGPR